MNFVEFKSSGPAQIMFRKLGLSDYLAAATSWYTLQRLIVSFNEPDKGHFVKIVKRADGACSSGERILLHAIATACDFAWLADKLGGRKVWDNMSYVDGEWRRCVAACIAQED